MTNAPPQQEPGRTTARHAPLLVAGAMILLALAPLVQAIPAVLPDLAVTKDDNKDPVEAGGVVTYYINITNQGLAPATTVHIEDTLPVGSTLLAVTPSTGCDTSTPGTFACDVGPIAPLGWYNLTVDVRMDTTGEKVNNVGVITRGDPEPANNGDSEVTTVIPRVPDLHIQKIDLQDPVYLGGDIEWIVNVTNEGTADAENVTIIDVAPAGVTFVSVTPTTGCSRGPPGTLTCNIGTLGPGESYELRIVGEPSIPGTNRNSVSVTSDQRERDLTDNRDHENTTVLIRPTVDLALTKDDVVDPVRVGDNITYVINVTNLGRTKAENVTVTDQLPSGVTLLAITPAAGCARIPGGFRCNIGDLDAGENYTLTVDVRADTAGTVTNGATVDPGEPAVDSDRSNNAEREQTTVGLAPPTDVRCVAQADEDILVAWAASPGATSYDLYRSVDGGPFSHLATTTQTSYEDTTTEAGHTYAYYVRANANGQASEASETCEATAIPFFPGAIGIGLAIVGSIAAVAAYRRKKSP